MNKLILLIGALAISATAWAQPNQDHTCQGGHNCNDGGSNEQGQLQLQLQGQAQQQSATSESDSKSKADSRSRSDSNSSSSSGGNSLSASGGQSSASATGGSSSAEAAGGNSESVAHGGAGGNASAAGGSSGDSSASSGGNSQDVNVGGNDVIFEKSASSAAAVFAGHCQSGGSGQLEAGGFSVVNTEQFCDYIRLAAIMREAYEWEMRDCECHGECSSFQSSVEMVCKPSEKAEKFLDAYYENLWDAQALLQTTETTATADRLAGHLTRPLALIGALIWLL